MYICSLQGELIFLIKGTGIVFVYFVLGMGKKLGLLHALSWKVERKRGSNFFNI